MENKTNTLLTVVLATNALSSMFTEAETEFVSAPPTFILSITHKKNQLQFIIFNVTTLVTVEANYTTTTT